MKRFIILITLIFLLPHASVAQNMDEQMFQSICLNLLQQDSLDAIYKMFDNKILVLEDPVTGEVIVKYTDTSDSKKMAALKSYSKDALMKIINGRSFPYLPLADTIYIIDSNNFFPDNYTFEKGGHMFKIERDDYFYRHFDNLRKYKTTTRQFIDLPNTRYLFLHEVRLCQNQINISFLFNNNKKGQYNFCFTLINGFTSPVKSGYNYDRFNWRDY